MIEQYPIALEGRHNSCSGVSDVLKTAALEQDCQPV